MVFVIYVTGDAHGERYKFYKENIPKDIYENDVIITCGDFGMVWYNERDRVGKIVDNEKLDDLSVKPYTFLFCDGNHENFNELNKYPVVDFCGGRAHKIRNNVFHLLRGEIYEIEGKKFFAMGGAYSIDKQMRQKDISWWEQEVPTYEEIQYARNNLEEHNNKVDYIISHTAPSRVITQMGYSLNADDVGLTDFFDEVMQTVSFKKWFFGHFHEDKQINASDDKVMRALYNEFEIAL